MMSPSINKIDKQIRTCTNNDKAFIYHKRPLDVPSRQHEEEEPKRSFFINE